MPAQRVHLPAVQGPPGQHQVPGLGEDAGEAPLHVQVCRPRLSGNVVVNHTAAESKRLVWEAYFKHKMPGHSIYSNCTNEELYYYNLN